MGRRTPGLQTAKGKGYSFSFEEWYMADVNNGGFDQIDCNSTGIVWEDAMNGFLEIGVHESIRLLRNPPMSSAEPQVKTGKTSS